MTLNKVGYVGYQIESSYSVRNPITPVGGTQLLSFGEFRDGTMPAIPSANSNIIERYIAAQLNPSDLSYGKMRLLEGVLEYDLVNGIPLVYGLGAVSTGGGPPYTHTITELLPTSTKLSRTIHFEEVGGTVEKAWDFPGCITKSLDLNISSPEMGQPLQVKESFIAQRKVTSHGDGGAKTKQAVIADSDKKPTVPTGSGTARYYWDDNSVCSHGGNSLLASVKIVNCRFQTDWVPLPGNTRTGIDEHGANIKRWNEDYKASKVGLAVTIILPTGETNTWDMLENLMAEVLDNDIIFHWERSATDYIKLTYDTSICPVMDVTAELIQFGMEQKAKAFRLMPMSVDIEVKDGIAGAAFL